MKFNYNIPLIGNFVFDHSNNKMYFNVYKGNTSTDHISYDNYEDIDNQLFMDFIGEGING